MTDRIDDGGAAFPGAADSEEGHRMREYGMSLRDWFAGMALSRMMELGADAHGTINGTVIAADCYLIADAMIAARKQKPEVRSCRSESSCAARRAGECRPTR